MARMQTWRRLCLWSMSSSITLFDSNSHISQIPPQIIDVLHFFSGRLVTSDFIIKYIEVRAVRWPEIWKIIRSHRLLHFWTGGSEWCTECQGRHSSGKGNDQQNLSKMIMGYRSVYNQNASDDWRYNIDVYKLMMHIMHLVLVNMIII